MGNGKTKENTNFNNLNKLLNMTNFFISEIIAIDSSVRVIFL